MQRNPVLVGPRAPSGERGRLAPLRVVLCAALCVVAAGCQTKLPPTRAEIQQQALENVALPTAWKAGGDAGTITDNWLATFNDAQLDARADHREVPL